MKFKVGDMVRLIDADTLFCITEGRCYETIDVWPFGRLLIKDDNGEEAFYSDYRFEGVNMKFKKGDIVRCVDGECGPWITKGRCYCVEALHLNGNGRYIQVKDDDGDETYHLESRFEGINEMANLEKGDIVVALEDDRDITKGKSYLVMGTYKQHGEMWANIYDDVRDKRSFTLSQKRFERIKMDEEMEIEARIEQCEVDRGKLGEEQERLEGKLKGLEVTYSIGDRFRRASSEYILVDTGNMCALLANLRTGLRWVPAHKVRKLRKITPVEFNQITDGDAFSRCWDSQKGEKV